MHSSAGRLRLCMGPVYRVCVFVCTVAALRGVGESKDWVPVPCSPAPHTPAPTGALKFWFVCFSSFIFVCLRCLPVSCASHRHPVCGLGIWPRVRVTAPRCPVFASHLSALLVGAPARWAWPVPTLVCIHPCLPVYFSCQGHGVCVCVPCSVSSLPFALLCVYQRAAVGRCPYMCQVVRLGSTVQHVHVLPVARACVFQFEKRPHPTPLLPALPCVAHALVSVLIVPCIVLGVVAVVVSCVCVSGV